MATACSGTDIAVVVLRSVGELLSGSLGVEVKLRHIYSCEVDEVARRWILTHVSPAPEHLFIDIHDLAEQAAYDVISGGTVEVSSSVSCR